MKILFLHGWQVGNDHRLADPELLEAMLRTFYVEPHQIRPKKPH